MGLREISYTAPYFTAKSTDLDENGVLKGAAIGYKVYLTDKKVWKIVSDDGTLENFVEPLVKLADVVFHDESVATGTGNIIEVNGAKSLTIHVRGTSTSRTIEFKGVCEDGSVLDIVGCKLGDVNFTMATSTTGMGSGEVWYFDSIEGLKEVYFDITAIAGGNISIGGRLV